MEATGSGAAGLEPARNRSGRIPEEVLRSEAQRAVLVHVSPLLERVVFPWGEEAYACPWDLVVLFRGRRPAYRLTVPNWGDRAWCDLGCNHFRVWVVPRGSPEALRVLVRGKRVYALLDGETVRFVVASRTKGVGAPWLP